MVRLAPEICASRSEMAHPCRGSRASVLRMRRSSVPCGRPVCGIGVIGEPLVLRQEASPSHVEVQDKGNGFADNINDGATSRHVGTSALQDIERTVPLLL